MDVGIDDGQFGLLPTKSNYLKRSYRMLTKCLVCTDLANTHKHFGGAASCFSCRAFFRRTVRKNEMGKCQDDHQNCVIDIKTRALCGYCRFQKCLSVGMDPQRVMKREELREKKKKRGEKTKKKKPSLSNSSYDTIDDDNFDDHTTTKSKESMVIKNLSELNLYDLDEYLGGEWERKIFSKKVVTPPPPVDPLPILDTIDLNVLMESDDEPVIETVMIHGCRNFTIGVIREICPCSTLWNNTYHLDFSALSCQCVIS